MYFYDNISINYSSNKKISENICRENQNTHFIFSNNFFENRAPFMRKCLTFLWSWAGHRGQCDTAHALYVLDT